MTVSPQEQEVSLTARKAAHYVGLDVVRRATSVRGFPCATGVGRSVESGRDNCPRVSRPPLTHEGIGCSRLTDRGDRAKERRSLVRCHV